METFVNLTCGVASSLLGQVQSLRVWSGCRQQVVITNYEYNSSSTNSSRTNQQQYSLAIGTCNLSMRIMLMIMIFIIMWIVVAFIAVVVLLLLLLLTCNFKVFGFVQRHTLIFVSKPRAWDFCYLDSGLGLVGLCEYV